MLIAVDRPGEKPAYIEVPDTNEKVARLKAYLFVYEGHTNPDRAEDPPNDRTLKEFTTVILVVSAVG